MSNVITKPPVWFWVVAGIGLIWNIIGVLSFISTVSMNAETLAALPQAEQALFANTPIWANVAFAVGVFGGVLGCLFLLLRKNIATILFIASLVGIVIQFSYWLFLTESVAVYGAAHAYAMPVVVTLIAAFLVWFANMAKGKGWIG